MVSRYGQLLKHIQEKVDALSVKQQKLVEAREQLLVEREEGMMSRKRIRHQRIRTGDSEIDLMKAFRQHFVQLARPLPSDLLAAYDRAEKEHSELRSLEEAHLQAEEDLGASEWMYMDLENDLYQYNISDLVEDELHHLDTTGDVDEETNNTPISATLIESTPTAQYQALIVEHGQLTKRFDALRKQQSIRMDTFIQAEEDILQLSENTRVGTNAEGLASELLDLIAKCETKMQQLRLDTKPLRQSASRSHRELSEPAMNHDPWFDHVERASPAFSEGASLPLESYIPVEEHINDWSLQSLKSSALEKIRYLNILRHRLNIRHTTNVEFGDWEPQLTRLWVTGHVEKPVWSGLDESIEEHIASHSAKHSCDGSVHLTVPPRVEHTHTQDANARVTSATNSSKALEGYIPTISLDEAFSDDCRESASDARENSIIMTDTLTVRSTNAYETGEKAQSLLEDEQDTLKELSLTVTRSAMEGWPMIRCDSAQGFDTGEPSSSMPPENKDLAAKNRDGTIEESEAVSDGSLADTINRYAPEDWPPKLDLQHRTDPLIPHGSFGPFWVQFKDEGRRMSEESNISISDLANQARIRGLDGWPAANYVRQPHQFFVSGRVSNTASFNSKRSICVLLEQTNCDHRSFSCLDKSHRMIAMHWI